MFHGSDYGLNDKISLKVHYKMGKYIDDVTSTQYTVNRWVFQNDLTGRTLSTETNTYYNLTKAVGAQTPFTSPQLVYNGNSSISFISNADTTVTAVKITGYTYSTRDVFVAQTRFKVGTPAVNFNNLIENQVYALRFQYHNLKGELTNSWGVIRIESIENPGAPNEKITFSYQYKPQSY